MGFLKSVFLNRFIVYEQLGKAEFVIAVPQKITPTLKVDAETASTFCPAGSPALRDHAVMSFARGTAFFTAAPLSFNIAHSVSCKLRFSNRKAKKPTTALVVLACAVGRAADCHVFCEMAKASPTLV